MISHLCSALNPRFARLSLRGIVVLFVLIPSLAAQTGYRSARHGARAEEGSSENQSTLWADIASFPLSFIPNAGQVAPDVRFEVRGMGGNLYFTPREVFMVLPSFTADTFDTVRLNYLGANPTPTLTGSDRLPGIVSYMLGNDPAQWQTDIPTYGEILYEELYPGITLQYDGTTGLLKGTFLISPGAAPDVIRWRYDGVQRVELDPATQDLRLYLSDEADAAYLTEFAPTAWQEVGETRVPVAAGYTLFEDQSIGLTVGDYDPEQLLFLDPLLQFSSYFGGASTDEGRGVAADIFGNVYITGRTDSTNLRITPETAAQIPHGGISDAYVTKINISTKQFVYSTYLGGRGFDMGNAIVVDANGSAYVTGETASDNFPVKPLESPYQLYAGGTDAFVAKLSPTGSALVYSTFLGGTASDLGHGIAVNSLGEAFVAGETGSPDFPILNALPGQGTYRLGESDGFVTKFLASGTAVGFSTFLGGGDVDRALAITVDPSNNSVYVAGRTDSVNFPTVNASQSSPGGQGDGFVSRLSGAAVPTFVFSTYLGGSGLDEATGIALGSGDKVYVTGETNSTNIVRTANALPGELGPTSAADDIDAFVGAYVITTGERVYFTYLGGSNKDKGKGIGLDINGNIYVVGETQSGGADNPADNFPHISGFQDGFGGLSDAFVTKIVAAGNAIEYSSFLGGTLSDRGFAVAVIGTGTLYMTGITFSTDFPPTVGSFTRGLGAEAFIVRIGSNQADISVEKIDDISTVAVGQDLSYTITVRSAASSDPSNVIMTDTLNAYLDYVSTETTRGSCTYDAGIRRVTCNLGTMLANDVVTVKLVVNVTSRPSGGVVSNRVQVTGSETEEVTTNNSHLQTTPILNEADLEVTKRASRYRVRQGEAVTFSVSIRNLGPGSTAGVELTDVLPANLTLESVTPPVGTTYDPVTGKWIVGTIAANTTVTLTLATRVGENVPIGTVITNSANNLVSIVSDPVSSNNASTVELRVVTDAPEPGCHPSPTNPNEVICLFP